MTMKTVFFVGINPSLIPAIQHLTRSSGNSWQSYFPGNTSEALEWISRVKLDVVLVEINFPDAGSIQLLNYLQKNCPQVVKIAVCDQKNILDHLRTSGLAQQFLNKSFDIPMLKTSIERAFTLRDLLSQNMLQRLIPQVRSLPSLPTLYLQIADELNKPLPSAEKVGQIISQDISMTAKVLQLVNSASFGLPYQVVNPTQATVLLGLEAIRDLVLTIKVFSNFDQIKLRHLGFTQLWNHSIAVGAASRLIARELVKDKLVMEYAFVAGLLHDLGKLVLADNLPMKYHSALEIAANKQIQLRDAELEVFGTTHAQVGAYLMWLWNLPDAVVVASAYHHTPSEHPEKSISPLPVVHMANVFVHETIHGGTRRWKSPMLDQNCLQLFGLADRVDDLRQVIPR